MYKILFIFLVIFFVMPEVKAQETPPTAAAILKEAYAIAGKENKKVLVMFHASWCIWCRKMDSSLTDISCKKFFEDNFVVRHMVVFETPEKKGLENPGALEFLTKYKGEKMGLPFWLIFDNKGTLLADAKIPGTISEKNKEGESTGCPATIKEVDYFLEVLKKTTPVTKDELEIIRKRFRKNDV